MVKLIIFFLVLLVSQTFPQDSTSANNESEFLQAVNLYKLHQYDQALNIFEKIAGQNEGKAAESFLFEGKILADIKKYPEAEKILREFLQQHPESRYGNEAHLTLAKIYLEQEKYKTSFLEICSILAETDSGYYSDYGKTSAERIALNYIEPDYLKHLNDSITSSNKAEKLKPFMLLLLGKLFYQENNYRTAEKYISELITNFPRSTERREAGEIFQKITESKKQSPSGNFIGVLLP
ncbi:MAG TPA: tetratricopeptide repeat protein, partial [Ignavibacteriaceae bacterium]|nr:tetratricopeptide repeat protein [Ignavibacteriaceae bacterium]